MSIPEIAPSVSAPPSPLRRDKIRKRVDSTQDGGISMQTIPLKRVRTEDVYLLMESASIASSSTTRRETVSQASSVSPPFPSSNFHAHLFPSPIRTSASPLVCAWTSTSCHLDISAPCPGDPP